MNLLKGACGGLTVPEPPVPAELPASPAGTFPAPASPEPVVPEAPFAEPAVPAPAPATPVAPTSGSFDRLEWQAAVAALRLNSSSDEWWNRLRSMVCLLGAKAILREKTRRQG